MELRIKELVEKYSLTLLKGEGGYFRFISTFGNNSGMIFYLITKDSFSSLHKLTDDEVWFFLEGDDSDQLIIDENEKEEILPLDKDNRVSLVKKNTYQATRLKKGGSYAFFSTIMSPKYQDDMYKLVDAEMLERKPYLREWVSLKEM